MIAINEDMSLYSESDNAIFLYAQSLSDELTVRITFFLNKIFLF